MGHFVGCGRCIACEHQTGPEGKSSVQQCRSLTVRNEIRSCLIYTDQLQAMTVNVHSPAAMKESCWLLPCSSESVAAMMQVASLVGRWTDSIGSPCATHRICRKRTGPWKYSHAEKPGMHLETPWCSLGEFHQRLQGFAGPSTVVDYHATCHQHPLGHLKCMGVHISPSVWGLPVQETVDKCCECFDQEVQEVGLSETRDDPKNLRYRWVTCRKLTKVDSCVGGHGFHLKISSHIGGKMKSSGYVQGISFTLAWRGELEDWEMKATWNHEIHY